MLADEPVRQEESKPSPVEAQLIVKKSTYVLPKKRHGAAFRKRIEGETDADRLPPPPRIDLVLELKNVSQEDVMIWPQGRITEPDLKVEGPGIVEPESLTSAEVEMGATGAQPTIAPGETYQIPIKSLNPQGGTPRVFWNEPGEYTITASYTVHTELPAFPFPDNKAPAGKPQQYTVTSPPVKVQVILEGEVSQAAIRKEK
jgi:hypothetical protein